MNKFSQSLDFMQCNVGHNQIRSDIEEDLLRQEMASLSLAGRGWQCGRVDDDLLIL